MAEEEVVLQLGVVVKAIELVVASGIGGGIVALIGKFVVDRKLEEQRVKYDKEMAGLKAGLDIYKQKHLKGYTDKIVIYRSVVDLLSEILGDLDCLRGISNTLSAEARELIGTRLDKFNRARMKAYGYLGMMAPQSIMDAYDRLVDYLFDVLYDGKKYEWPEVRRLALEVINEVRKDIGIDERPISYYGKR